MEGSHLQVQLRQALTQRKYNVSMKQHVALRDYTEQISKKYSHN